MTKRRSRGKVSLNDQRFIEKTQKIKKSLRKYGSEENGASLRVPTKLRM